MIKHVVMFKLKEYAEGNSLKENALQIKDILEKLPESIPQVVKFDVGIDIVGSDRSWDLVLVSAFNNIAELNEYRVHSEHIKALEFIAPLRDLVAVVDYEY